jgi:hypothetical protein
MEVKMSAILAINLYDNFNDKVIRDKVNRLFKNKITIKFPIFNKTFTTIINDKKTYNKLSDVEKKYYDKINKLNNCKPILIISFIDLPPISDDFSEGPVNIDSKHYINHSEFFLEDTFRKRILDLILSINLAYCGGININEGRLFRNGKKVNKFDTIISDLDFSKVLSLKKHWPKLKSLDINKTFKWFMNFKDSLDDISNSRIGRAVNAFTYLFHTSVFFENDLSDLVWSLIGLESIYTEGNIDLQNQLDLKSQLLLGKRQEYKKIVKDMYAYRSQYLHGKLNFASQFSDKDTSHFFDKFYPELYEVTNTAVGTLISTLQYFVINNITDINFKHIYKPFITKYKDDKKNISVHKNDRIFIIA